jgi:hypothetical protein
MGEGMHGLSHTMHSFSTAQNLCHRSQLMAILATFVNKFSRHRRTIEKTPENLPEENSAYFEFFLSGRSNS